MLKLLLPLLLLFNSKLLFGSDWEENWNAKKNSFNLENFRSIQEKLTGALQNGRWVDSYNLGDKLSQWPMYVRPCTQEGPYFDSFWVGDSTHGACFRSIYNEGERFTWVPDTDQQVFYPWSAPNMCQMMNGRKVLIVGDSLSQQFYETFLSAML
jgi:hypothetical protein